MPVLRSRVEVGNDAGSSSVSLGRVAAPDAAVFDPDPSGEAHPHSLLPVCGNERCRARWLRLWRRRQTPRFEGAWACSSACLEEMVRAAVARESGNGSPEMREHRHRVPLGLMLYAQGVITQPQLRAALEAQRKASAGEGPQRRIGRWLIQQASLNEWQLARALSTQWNCPLYSGERMDPFRSAQLLPRLLVESCGAVPLRQTAAGKILLAFEDSLDHCLSLALERMHGVEVEAGVLAAGEFLHARETLMSMRFPRLRVIEVANRHVLARALAERIEHSQPVEAALVRVHEYYWLRMWKSLDRDPTRAEDVLALEAPFG